MTPETVLNNLLTNGELSFTFIRSAGPGGQNVNKVSTAVQMRFDLQKSPSIPTEIKERLIRLSGSKITRDGVLIIEAKRYRTQEQNKLDVQRRFLSLLQKAWVKPPSRHPTRPSLASQVKRVDSKKKRGFAKRLRGNIDQAD